MLVRNSRLVRSNVASSISKSTVSGVLPRRLQSTKPQPSNASGAASDGTSKEMSEDERRKAAAALAMQSLKDMKSLLSSAPPEDENQPIDTRPIFEDPTLFPALSLLHQGQVTKELQDKFDKKWHKLTIEDKKLGYYMSYGNWGVRENFDNWKSLEEPPLDLPFHTPSKVATATPSKDTKINLLTPPVVLAETPVRKPQFNVKRIDGATKFFIYAIVLVAMVAVYRDKNVGEEGKPKEQIITDPYEERRIADEKKREEERQREEEERIKREQRKWYYLWLR